MWLRLAPPPRASRRSESIKQTMQTSTMNDPNQKQKSPTIDPVQRQRAVFLLRQMRDTGVPDLVRKSAREELCALFERLAYYFGRSYLSSASVGLIKHGWDNDDVRAECLTALVQALDYWNPAKGDITAALCPLVRVRLRKMLRRAEMVKRPMSRFVSHYHAGLRGDDETAEATAPVPVYSFEYITREGDSCEREFGLMTEREDEEIILKLSVRQALGRLSDRQRQAVSLCYGFDGHEPHTLREAGLKMGCSHQWVRELLQQATVQLQGSLAAFA